MAGECIALTPVRQKGGKLVYAWACEGDLDVGAVVSNAFTMEWPRGSGKQMTFPEVDRAEWFSVEEARQKMNAAQTALIEELVEWIGGAG